MIYSGNPLKKGADWLSGQFLPFLGNRHIGGWRSGGGEDGGMKEVIVMSGSKVGDAFLFVFLPGRFFSECDFLVAKSNSMRGFVCPSVRP